MGNKKGNIIGGAALITGSCVGAGALGLPVVTGLCGFFPSLFFLFFMSGFMMISSFLLVEALSWFPEQEKINLPFLVSQTMGPVGVAFCWGSYLFLFYSLLIAYIDGIGAHISNISYTYLKMNLPSCLGSLFFVLLFGGIIYFGIKPIDIVNRILIVIKICVFLVLVGFVFPFIHLQHLANLHLKYALIALPILVVSFGFQNVIPTLFYYLGKDVKRTQKSIFLGVICTFCIYLLWQITAIGSIPFKGPGGLLESYNAGIDAALALSKITKMKSIQYSSSLLAFFAILTSFLAQSISLVHFLSDGFKIKESKMNKENLWICLLVLVPSTLFAMANPGIFYLALQFAGGICAVFLFGILPSIMIWIGRYKMHLVSNYSVAGEEKLLIGVLVISSTILVYQIANFMM